MTTAGPCDRTRAHSYGLCFRCDRAAAFTKLTGMKKFGKDLVGVYNHARSSFILELPKVERPNDTTDSFLSPKMLFLLLFFFR